MSHHPFFTGRPAPSTSLDSFSPTAEQINALPERIRSYIHQLQTVCDPSGDTQNRILAEDTCRSQEIQIADLQRQLAEAQAFGLGVAAWSSESKLTDNPYGDRSETPQSEAWKRGWLKVHYAALK